MIAACSGWRIACAALAALASVTSVAATGAAAPTSSGEWERLGPSPLARTEVTAGRVGGSIYVVGGFESGGVPSRAVERFNPRDGEWTILPPLPTGVNHAGVVGWRGDVYVFGGFVDLPLAGAGTTSDRLFRFDSATESWAELAHAPVPRAAFAAGVVRGRLYVAGGSTDDAPTTRRVDIYSFRSDRWRSGPSLTVAREHVAGAVAGRPGSKRFYVLGGRDFYGAENYRTVERLNPRVGRWRPQPEMLVGHGGFGAVGVGRRVIAVGGERPGQGVTGTIATTEAYDPRSRRWTRLADLPTPRHGLGVAAFGGRVYAIEGGPVTLVAVSDVVESLPVR